MASARPIRVVAGLVAVLALSACGSVILAAAPRIYTNEDLPSTPGAPAIGASPSGGAEGSDTEGTLTRTPAPSSAVLSYDTYRDRDGHDAAWWQHRLSVLQEHIAQTEAELEAAHNAIKNCPERNGGHCRGAYRYTERGRYYDYSYRGRAFMSHKTPLDQRFAAAADRLKDLRAGEDELREEARRSGALPGWIRAVD